MMKIWMIAGSAMLLGACWGAPPNEKLLTGLCQDIFVGDTDVINQLTRDTGADLDEFCACYAATIVSQPTKIPLHKDVSSAISEARRGTSLDAEGAAERVEEMIQSGEIDTFTEDQLSEVGDDYQDVGSSMEDNGGTCPA